MLSFENEADLVQDREDLLALLNMRFGDVPPGVVSEVYKINELDTLERLILVASNATRLKIFLEELEEGAGNFKILGERFNPIEDQKEGGDVHEENQ